MIAELKPYDSYRESELPWLAALPSTWKVLRAKNVFRVLDVRSPTGEEELLTVSAANGVIPRREQKVTMFKAESYVGHKLCWPGDIVVNSLWAWMQGLGVANHHGIVSTAYSVYRAWPTYEVCTRYFHYALRSEAYKWELQTRSKGVWTSRLQLSDAAFLDMPMLIPPPDEQYSIVRFLDHTDRQIRRYIRAKQKLIKLLEEQNQAIIHRAITRGLSADPNLQPSGNDWFPSVPQGWQVLPLRRIVVRVVDGPHHSPEYVDSGIPFLSARNIKVDKWSLEDVKYISASDHAELSKRVVPEAGDVLYTKGGTTGVARAVDLDFPFQVWVHVAVLKLNRNYVEPNFLAYALNSPHCYEQSQLLTRGATNQDLGLNRMKDIIVPVPPLPEQRAIASSLDRDTAALRVAIERIEGEIALLREYRTRIITDAVTGHLDVRAAASVIGDDITSSDLEVGAELMDDDSASAEELSPELVEMAP